MANIPENTENPVLRPVSRLETTTKVYGGEYIPDDAEQRGISNLQAIELAERDQYIISRVGQAAVPPEGDIPGEVGIASLDSNGRLPKAQNTSDTVFTGDTQTLTNKTIAIGSNNITGTASRMVQTDANGKLSVSAAGSDDYLTTTNTKTLTNKTIAIGSNTITGTADKLVVTDSNGVVTTSTVSPDSVVTLSGTQTLTNKTITYAGNTMTGVVGETATQTLTNKTISFADNTMTGVASTTTAQTLTNKTITYADNTMTGVVGETATQTLTNKTIDSSSNTIQLSPTYARSSSTITISNGLTQLYFDGSSTGGPYTLSDGPYNGYPLQITVTTAGAPYAVISFKYAGATVTKTLSSGVHHLTWQEATTGWTFVEFSGTYTDDTTFTYLI